MRHYADERVLTRLQIPLDCGIALKLGQFILLLDSLFSSYGAIDSVLAGAAAVLTLPEHDLIRIKSTPSNLPYDECGE
jgi:hypothetical protein